MRERCAYIIGRDREHKPFQRPAPCVDGNHRIGPIVAAFHMESCHGGYRSGQIEARQDRPLIELASRVVDLRAADDIPAVKCRDRRGEYVRFEEDTLLGARGVKAVPPPLFRIPVLFASHLELTLPLTNRARVGAIHGV